jgi:hypothetical protein
VGADLGAEPEREAAAREQLEAVRQVHAAHRVSREGDRDRRRQLDARRVLGCHGERQEGIGFRDLRSGRAIGSTMSLGERC